MTVPTRIQAQGRWRGILAELGLGEEFMRDVHGPCPLCGGTDRYRFDDQDGHGTYFCSQCGPGDGLKLACGIVGDDFATVAKRIDGMVSTTPKQAPPPPKKDPLIRLRDISRRLGPIDGLNPVSLYLLKRKIGPALPGTLFVVEKYYDENGQFVTTYPTMAHKFVSPTNQPITYHLTYLTKDGEKAPVKAVKKICPPHGKMAGGAIRLTPMRDGHVGVCEGIETAYAVMARFDVAVWPTGNAQMLKAFQPPEGCTKVTVFIDNDKNYVGGECGYGLAARLVREGYEVDLKTPVKAGTDFHDEWEFMCGKDD